jgi:hypothetical protein
MASFEKRYATRETDDGKMGACSLCGMDMLTLTLFEATARMKPTRGPQKQP